MSNQTKSLVSEVLSSIAQIQKYTENVSEEAFLTSLEKQDAVLHRIFIISEVAKRISAQTRKKHDQIPWKQIIEMPKSLLLNDFGTDGKAIWNTVQTTLPEYGNGPSNR